MQKNSTPLDEIFDETILTETAFVKEDGKLRMVRRKVVNTSKELEKPLFPIDKVRQ